MGIPKIVDFAADIKDTRDEIIAIKFTGCIKNIGELLYNAASGYSNFNTYWLEEYPRLNILKDAKSIEERFYLSSFYTGQDFLRFVRGNKPMKNEAEFANDYGKLASVMDPFTGSATNIELMIRNIANNDICKAIYIYDFAISEKSMIYLSQLFDGVAEKIKIYNMPIGKLLNEHPEITTVFHDSSDEMVEWIQGHQEGSDDIKGKCFMLSANPGFCKNFGEGDTIYKYQKLLTELPYRYKAMASWWQMKYIPYFNNLLHN